MLHKTKKRQRGTYTKKMPTATSFFFSPQTVGTNVIYEMTRGAWMGIDELVGYDLIQIG